MDAAQQLYHTFKQRISAIADPDPQRTFFFLSFVVVEDAWLWSILCACGCASWLISLCIPPSTSLPVCTVFYVLCETDVERRLSAARDLCESLDVSPLLFPLLLSSYPLYLFLCIVYVLFIEGLHLWSVHNERCVLWRRCRCRLSTTRRCSTSWSRRSSRSSGPLSPSSTASCRCRSLLSLPTSTTSTHSLSILHSPCIKGDESWVLHNFRNFFYLIIL